MNGKKIFWIVVAAVVIIGSFLAGVTVGNKAPGALLVGGDYNNGYAAGMDAARKKLVESGLVPPSPAEVKTLSGTVKSVDGGKFVITVSGRITPNPLDSQGPAERTVLANDKTQIVAQVPMTPDKQAAAMKAFQDAMRAGKQASPPTPYTEETVKADAIKLGMVITVTSADNIKTATTINASKIVFTAIPSAVPVVPTK
jgi:hypothetical protein